MHIIVGCDAILGYLTDGSEQNFHMLLMQRISESMVFYYRFQNDEGLVFSYESQPLTETRTFH